MSFAGGGSDLPAFYRLNGGAVLSAAIDKYVYVSVNRKFDSGTRIAYSKTEEVERVDQIEHKIVRATMEHLGLNGGVEITTIADIPSKGTGLGSSSTFTVGLLHVLNAYLGKYVSKDRLGAESSFIEIDRCGEPIGKQDQYAAAFGGLNFIEFHADESVQVTPVICSQNLLKSIQQNILVFYTGLTRSASELLKRQGEEIGAESRKQAALKRMVDLAYQLRDELHRGNPDAFGPILHENWVLKKSLTSGISTEIIDDWYQAGLHAGASGGKLLGAGAGGFLMFYADADRHDAIKAALPNLRPIPMAFDLVGSRIIHFQAASEAP